MHEGPRAERTRAFSSAGRDVEPHSVATMANCAATSRMGVPAGCGSDPTRLDGATRLNGTGRWTHDSSTRMDNATGPDDRTRWRHTVDDASSPRPPSVDVDVTAALIDPARLHEGVTRPRLHPVAVHPNVLRAVPLIVPLDPDGAREGGRRPMHHDRRRRWRHLYRHGVRRWRDIGRVDARAACAAGERERSSAHADEQDRTKRSALGCRHLVSTSSNCPPAPRR